MLLGAGLLILAGVLGLLGTAPVFLFTSLIALGFGWAATYGAGGILVKQVVQDEARFAAQGRNEFVIAFFTGIGSAGAGPIYDALGWQTMSWAAIILVMLLIPLILRLRLP